MPHIKRKDPIVFGGGQRSSGVNRGQTLKTLLARYLERYENQFKLTTLLERMRCGERKNPIVFGGGQRSSGVTRGQNLKTLFTRYLKVGSLDRFHTKYVDVLWCKEEPYRFWWRSKVIWGHRGSKSEKLVYMILQGCSGKPQSLLSILIGQNLFC
ncbi:hypothetical protein HOLleu_14627 [Holothuria leucospilota]|uniref:Uncharacterized protein n=1 Tax=Holothuria leucospilota TaxID=206669 RepID=A0A9Q1H928_HOLLE|nr:hypothetical protein HOLleu_14627 [Holothuria leucospilota]